MLTPMPASLAIPAELMLILFKAAAESLRAAHRSGRPDQPRRRVGRTLRPGAETPLWNELVRQTLPDLRKRGEKVKLARMLGVPRQRVHEFVRARNACADAERALLLLCWVARRKQGRELTG